MQLIQNMIMINHFEQLPDELLLDLFENYIRLFDLYMGFYTLNHRRINGILHSVRLYIDLPQKDIFHIQSFAHFASQIVSLRVSIFCRDLDLSKLVNLRSLHIEKPTREQLISICADRLPNLCYLSLSPCWYSVRELPKHLIEIADRCQFKYLRRCILPGQKVLHIPRVTLSKETRGVE